MTEPDLLFDFSAVSGCYYAAPGNHYGVGRVTYGFALELAKHFPERLAISSGDFSAECRPFLEREFPNLAKFCIEPRNSSVDYLLMRWVNLAAEKGGMRTDLSSKIRRALWRPYDNNLRWQRSPATKRVYRQAKLIHSEFQHPVVARCPKARAIYTVHDLIGVTGDGVSDEVRIHKTKQFKNAWAAGAHFVCDSKYTADSLTELIGRADDRIGWSGLGLDPVFRPVEKPFLLEQWKTKFGIANSQRYVVAHTGQLERKNLLSVIHVVKTLRLTEDPELILLFLGYPKDLEEEFDKHLPPSIQWRDFIRFSGNLADEDFPVIYSGAELMLFLSWAEGFGLPALEAMGCGVPLICSNRTSLPEVVGDGGILVDPANLEEVTALAADLLQNQDLRNSLRSRGLERASSLNWTAAGNRLKDLWNNIIDSL
jgi:glycosyltransferase involved in cell wall biosynthesis